MRRPTAATLLHGKIGASDTVTGKAAAPFIVNLKPGTYTFYCSVDGHEWRLELQLHGRSSAWPAHRCGQREVGAVRVEEVR